MSERPVNILIADILDAVSVVLQFSNEVVFEEFVADRMRRDAIIRNIEIVGEAVNKLPEKFINSHNEVEWHKAVAMRNRLIHGYFDIDYRIVWNTIKNVFPHLNNSYLTCKIFSKFFSHSSNNI